jgi:hypothetical protein
LSKHESESASGAAALQDRRGASVRVARNRTRMRCIRELAFAARHAAKAACSIPPCHRDAYRPPPLDSFQRRSEAPPGRSSPRQLSCSRARCPECGGSRSRAHPTASMAMTRAPSENTESPGSSTTPAPSFPSIKGAAARGYPRQDGVVQRGDACRGDPDEDPAISATRSWHLEQFQTSST